MSPFYWRIAALLGLLFSGLVIATVGVTLSLVEDMRNNNLNDTRVTFVEVMNWIYVALLGLTLLSILFTSPFLWRYARRNDSIISTGLKPATGRR